MGRKRHCTPHAVCCGSAGFVVVARNAPEAGRGCGGGCYGRPGCTCTQTNVSYCSSYWNTGAFDTIFASSCRNIGAFNYIVGALLGMPQPSVPNGLHQQGRFGHALLVHVCYSTRHNGQPVPPTLVPTSGHDSMTIPNTDKGLLDDFAKK
ncbi:uncharacterized protein C8Q71DRAFT_423922 [Rhodofomes roseus]|uniref:Uncharacterized protein n=1 Tax=Rhodofomes roseus TaxID=34475 RepID=A0ABQ8KQJ6_9APHY|nr:uncharacterized protein C8Q71DRAFT_423922 [Rhodofomes roseus]KAH9840800.1 hypothetical protein C8Q71DRAFT_423922 [Rhodofomes roseus]